MWYLLNSLFYVFDVISGPNCRVTTNLTEPDSLTRRPFLSKNLTEPYNSSFFIITLQNLTEGVLGNFTHKERENASFFKNLRLRRANNPLRLIFMFIPLKYFLLDHPPEVENLTDITCWKDSKLHKNNSQACKMTSQNVK